MSAYAHIFSIYANVSICIVVKGGLYLLFPLLSSSDPSYARLSQMVLEYDHPLKKMDRRDISQLLDEHEDEGKDREQALQTLMMTEKFEKYQTVFR